MGNSGTRTSTSSSCNHGSVEIRSPDGSAMLRTYDLTLDSGRVTQNEMRVDHWDPKGHHDVFVKGFCDNDVKSTKMAEESKTQIAQGSMAFYPFRLLHTIFRSIFSHFRWLFESEVTVSRNSSVSVTSSADGSTIVAKLKEMERNGELQEALHQVKYVPPPDCPREKEQTWERSFSSRSAPPYDKKEDTATSKSNENTQNLFDFSYMN